MKILSSLLVVISVLFTLVAAPSCALDQVKPNIRIGALVFKERCVLCHGNAAMGEGILPLKIKGYPSTNLLESVKDLNRDKIKEAIIYGGSLGTISEFMPPMGNDLTWTETESAVEFVMLLKNNQTQALAMLKDFVSKSDASRKIGQQLYESRCALCHGKYGDGKGRMAKVIQAPPPANLTLSRLPDNYLNKIIRLGGEGVGRSPKMPPWGMQFETNEIDSIIIYIKSLRR